jgi:hypothetical protein
MIPGEFEQLENLVKVAKKRRMQSSKVFRCWWYPQHRPWGESVSTRHTGVRLCICQSR